MGREIVECRSESQYAQRPVALTWNTERQIIEKIETEWRSSQGKHFRVRCQGGCCYELIYFEDEDHWQIIPA